jgi:hypothetical protein
MESRVPAALPDDARAAAAVRAWVAAAGDLPPQLSELDLRGADFSGLDLGNGLLLDAVVREVPLRGADLYRARLERADLTGADLTGAALVKAELDEAVLRDAVLRRADLGGASLWGADARGADLSGASLNGAGLARCDLRGANLTDVSAVRTSFRVLLDDATAVRGLSGSLFGSLTVIEGGVRRVLDAAGSARWLNDRGARVRSLAPGGS